MEKGLRMGAGQTSVQKYWHELLSYVEQGKADLSFIISHHLPLERAPEGYKMFDEKSDNCIKVVLRPGSMLSAT